LRSVERLLTVEFGPSRSKRFGKALAQAQSGPGECTEVEPGRYRARFVLGEEAAAYLGLARLLERVRHWRATEVYEGDEPVSVFHAKEYRGTGLPAKALWEPRELCEGSKSAAPRRFGVCTTPAGTAPESRLGGVREREEGVLDFKTRFSNGWVW
jgi:hypothetical protein